MKEIAIFKDGSAAVIDAEDTVHVVSVNGEDWVALVPATEENMEKYFGTQKTGNVQPK